MGTRLLSIVGIYHFHSQMLLMHDAYEFSYCPVIRKLVCLLTGSNRGDQTGVCTATRVLLWYKDVGKQTQ